MLLFACTCVFDLVTEALFLRLCCSTLAAVLFLCVQDKNWKYALEIFLFIHDEVHRKFEK